MQKIIIYMGKKIILLLWAAIMVPMAVCHAGNKFTLVIDAGHGGHDAGAVGVFSKEKNINLSVALAFGRYVERNCPDVKVIYTRRRDVFVTLYERANIANRNKADLFVSIHTNALPKGKKARGMETYTLGMHRASDNFDVAKRENSVILYEKDYRQRYEGFDPNSSESYIMFEFLQDKNMAQSVEMAKFVQRRTCGIAGRQNKGVKQAGFLVLRETSMPGCLVELGFITTADEERYLNTTAGVDAMGRGLYMAFTDYIRKYNSGIKVPFRVDRPAENTDKPAGRAEVPAEKAETPKVARMAKDTATAAVGASVAQPVEAAGRKPVAAEEEKPLVAERPEKAHRRDPARDEANAAETGAKPVFKIQLLASGRNLRPDSRQFKQLQGVECYEEDNLYKYTYGSSADYNKIYRLRKTILDKFPGAFVIAFKNGEKMNVGEAIKEFKRNRNIR